MPANQSFTNRKDASQIAFQIEKGKTKSERQKTKSKKGCLIWIFVYFQIEHPENENEKINPLDGADLETEKLNREKA